MDAKEQIATELTKLPESTNTEALIALASQAQTLKIKEVLNRLDVITQLDPSRVKSLTDVLGSVVASGNCGIGCW